MRRIGVTLIEMLVALSLSALMVLAISGVLRSLTRQSKRMNAPLTQEWRKAFDHTLWTDVSQASGMALTEGALILDIPGAITSSIVGKTRVTYSLKPKGDQRFSLARTVFESSVDNPGNMRRVLTQTILWDVQQALFERIDDRGTNQPIPREIGPAPKAIEYRLWLNDSDVITHRIFVR